MIGSKVIGLKPCHFFIIFDGNMTQCAIGTNLEI